VKRPTIRDVALRAGVSHQTVSRVINGDRAVIGPTRERVLAAIRELDYVPNAIARSLSVNRTHTLGVVTADISDYAFGQAVAGAEAEARRHGYLLVIGSVGQAAGEDAAAAYLRLMGQRRVEGVVLDWPTLRPDDAMVGALATSRLPVITIAAHPEVSGLQVVDVDNRHGGFDATGFLIGRGHRAIATVTGPLRWNAAEARLLGYQDALRGAGLPALPELVESGADWGPAGGQAATARLLGRSASFTAIFAQSDLLAVGAITELRLRGIRVPQDVSVVGYDDIPVARFLDPPLTTMAQPIREVGELAARFLIGAVVHPGTDGGGSERLRLLPATLVVRGSVAERA
jgi:DNA-binding LacI/PurR family transcriptional regulator